MSGAVDLIIEPRQRDLGGFFVRRLLPFPNRRNVGPFVFFDHLGPADMPPGKGMDVRSHPHIGLATVTWLFDGALDHRDSLGTQQTIRPGAVNWMTAGRGIAHSERTPDVQRRDALIAEMSAALDDMRRRLGDAPLPVAVVADVSVISGV